LDFRVLRARRRPPFLRAAANGFGIPAEAALEAEAEAGAGAGAGAGATLEAAANEFGILVKAEAAEALGGVVGGEAAAAFNAKTGFNI